MKTVKDYQKLLLNNNIILNHEEREQKIIKKNLKVYIKLKILRIFMTLNF